MLVGTIRPFSADNGIAKTYITTIRKGIGFDNASNVYKLQNRHSISLSTPFTNKSFSPRKISLYSEPNLGIFSCRVDKDIRDKKFKEYAHRYNSRIDQLLGWGYMNEI